MTPQHKPMEGQGVNRTTGEVIDITGHVAVEAGGRKHRRKERSHNVFTLVDNPRMAQLELTQQESRVFWAICSALRKDDGSLARIGTGELSERTGMLPSNVSTTIASLKRRRIVQRERVGVWRINPWLLFAGSAEDWETETEDAPQPIWNRS